MTRRTTKHPVRRTVRHTGADAPIRGVIFDLDGTVYRGDEEVPGAARFVRWLDAHGIRRLFVTNRANRPPEEVAFQLAGIGIPCETADVLTSAQAAALYLKRRGVRRVYCIGEQGMRLALNEAGIALTERRPEHVVVSFDRSFDYDKLRTACRLILSGSGFIATNADRQLRTHEGLLPGTGTLVAAICAGTGVDPLVIGKPCRLIIDLALERLSLPASEVIAVGDNLETDIPAGVAAGVRTAFILTGVSTREQLRGAAARPTWVVQDFKELARLVARL